MSTADAILQVTQASRILYALGIVDAFGHVSCRHPERPDRFLMSRSMAPGLVTIDDVVEHDLDGNAPSAPETKLFVERFIHAEIYRNRPEVGGVAHSHAMTVVPFTAVDVEVRPVAHTCGFLLGTGPAFDIADHAGDGTDLLVRDAGLGRALAAHMGEQAVVLMRGHGFTTVGATIEEAVFRAYYTAANCELQMAALRLGEPHYLSPAEAAACDASTRKQVDRAWNLWVHEHAQL